jgi:hypothetical protein
MRWLAPDRTKAWVGCSIGKGTDGSSSTSMAPDRPLDNVLCRRRLTCLPHKGVYFLSVRLGTLVGSVERWCAPVRRECSRIPIVGWQALGERAMGITEVNCCLDWR